MANKHEKMVRVTDYQRNVSVITQYFSTWATYVSQPREFFFFNNAEAHLSFLELKSGMECQALVFIEVILYSLNNYDV